jgi:acyl-coenzyme A synthetase/AMP-(fatty) acid ligase
VNVSEGPEQRLWLDSPLHGADGPVLTQDRIRIEPDGFVHLGRNDDVVKVGAKRVALSDLEHFVRTLPHVSDVAAIAVADPGLREQALWLAVATTSAADRIELEARLRAALREHFDSVIVPRRIRVVAHLPRNAVGKLPREALLALFDGPRGPDVELSKGAGETNHGARS